MTGLRKSPGHTPRPPANAVRAARVLAIFALVAAAGCQGGDEGALSVVISIPDQQLPPASKATLLVDYSGTGARLLSEAGGPACAFLLPGVDGEFSDDRQGTLTIHASGQRATRGPADLAACRMKAGDEGATASDLASRITVRVQAAEDAGGKPIDLAAAAAKQAATGGSGGGRKSVAEVEEAQAKAVEAAATITRAAREQAAADPDAASDPTRAGGGAGLVTPGGAGSGAGAPGSAPTPPTARAAAPANVPRAAVPVAPVANAPEVVDNSAMPGGDRDPGYDDSQADDPNVPAYSLDFHVQTPGTFGALQLDVNHLGNGGGFIGRGDKVECVPLVEAIVASNYLGEREVKIGLISLQGINTPATIMRCGFRSRESVSAGSFLIEVTDASDTESKPIEPKPTVFIKSVVPRR